MKIVTIVGARPQFIKMGPVSRALRGVADEVIIHTGQHYDDNMSQVFFTELEMPEPKVNLDIGSGSHARQTGEMLLALDELLGCEQPDYVLVYGDTNSTLAGVLAAVQRQIPVAHVEAGLRSFNRAMPEENNRVVADALANLLFCPTDTGVENLKKENVVGRIVRTGDVMCDAVLYFRDKAAARRSAGRYGVAAGGYYLATMHRPANTDNADNLKAIFAALHQADAPVLLPLHPRTRKMADAFGVLATLDPEQVRVIPPQGYLDMLSLLQGARKLLTDSGGLQKEAYILGVPCITMRTETEWVETLAGGWNRVTGADTGKILEALRQPVLSSAPAPLYGDGAAAQEIVAVLREELS